MTDICHYELPIYLLWSGKWEYVSGILKVGF